METNKPRLMRKCCNMALRPQSLVFILVLCCILTLHTIQNNETEFQLLVNKSSTISCENIIPRSYVGQKGQFFALYNYIKATRRFKCDESITFATPADVNHLDVVVTLVERWQGPVSVALYVPDRDLESAIYRIEYLRECVSPIVKQLATFHLFFDQKFIPSQSSIEFPKGLTGDYKVNVDCSQIRKEEREGSFRQEMKLTFPINVARNIAREMATTHFLFSSDIELFPSVDFIPKFLHMIETNLRVPENSRPMVFVLPIFEVEANVSRLPDDKLELKEMLKNNTAVSFHKFTCPQCNTIPMYERWLEIEVRGDSIEVFHTAKRTGTHVGWEPIFVGTRNEPLFDERLSWEGQSEKMTQNFIMCILDYDYKILDNAFLVHSPGIKRKSNASYAQEAIGIKQNQLIKETIEMEIQLLYGSRKGCHVR